MFIFQGAHGGEIEDELADHPPCYYCTTQANGWMDRRIRLSYLRDVMAPKIESALVLLVDNLKRHAPTHAHDVVSVESYSVFKPSHQTLYRFVIFSTWVQLDRKDDAQCLAE